MKNWYSINKENVVNIKKKKTYRDVFILDEIGGFGTSARNFIRDLQQIDADIINLHVDSPGGSITDGIAIYNAIRSHPSNVDVYINGMAGSIASIIILAGDRIFIPENSSIFTHLPMVSSLEMPNREDMEESIKMLEQFEKVLANIYMKHTGADLETVTGWMENETFFFGQEAVDVGLATEVVDKIAMVAQYDITKYAFHKSLPQGEVVKQQENKQEETKTMNEEIVNEVADEVIEEVEETSAELDESTEEAVAVEEVADEVEEEVEEVEDEVEYEEDAEEALALEKERKEGILALSEKYNQSGLLNSQVIEALAGETSVDEFKDIVLEVLAKAPKTEKLNKLNKSNKDTDADALRSAIAECKDPVKKGQLARQLREIR